MSTSPLARLGTAVLAVVLATTGLTTPAHAAAETGKIEGRLTSHTGEPVGNARVAVYSAETEDDNYVGDTATAEDGTFSMTEVPAGGVRIGFETEGGLDQWATGKRNRAEASVLTVPAGGTLTVDERLLASGRITGRLTTATGAPVEWSEVSAWSEDNENIVPYGYLDADGRYSIEVAPGEYAVQFRLNNFEQWAYQKRDQESAKKFTVAAGQTVSVDDTLLPTGGLTGQLVDAAGAPLAEASVSLVDGDTTMGTTTTDHNGDYTFDGVLAGAYRVAFSLHDGAVQWAYGKRSAEQAAVITVTAGQVARVDDTFGATGAVAGRFTDAQGNGLANHKVELTDDSGTENPATYETETDAEGNYRFERVLTGRYVVAFVNQETWRRQYAYGKGSADDADRITVKAGDTTTVNDSLVAGATLRITARDARTGAPVTDFCAYAMGPAEGGDCTTGSEVVVDNLPAGSYEISVSPNEGGLYLWAEARTTVTAGQTREVAIPMRLGGAIQTTVTAAGTGQPVADACLIVVAPGEGFPSEGHGGCSDEQGRVQAGPLEPGRYTVFVRPSWKSGLGIQWLGRTGGTGDQRGAVQVTVRAGQVASAPAVKLDPAGSVTGTVTTADGKPAEGGIVSYSAWGYGIGPSGDTEIDNAGRYTLTGFGPYEWPVLFTPWGAPRQWSGGTGDRFKATKVKVTPGGSSRYDITLKPGAVLKGAVTRPAGGIESGRFTAYNVVTGDPIGVAEIQNGRYEMPIIGSQQVQIGYYVDAGGEQYLDGWYDGAADRAHARRVSVPATGSRTLNITIR